LAIRPRHRAPVSKVRQRDALQNARDDAFKRQSAVKKLLSIIACSVILLLPPQAQAADLGSLVSSLKAGGHVIVIRHVATDDSQKDIYPFKFDDMTSQRQLSEAGREVARQSGAAFKRIGVPIGEVYTSRLNRAVETGKLLAGRDVSPVDELTDSGAGGASAMANPDGRNAKLGRALRDLVNTNPKPGLNNLVITHKTNIADAFGKDFGDVREGEALVFKPSASGPAVLVTRVQAGEWIAQAGG
jgi:phosphohistidine phosphatase SixA